MSTPQDPGQYPTQQYGQQQPGYGAPPPPPPKDSNPWPWVLAAVALTVYALLRRFRPEYVGADPAPLNATVTLTPKGGLHFRIRELG